MVEPLRIATRRATIAAVVVATSVGLAACSKESDPAEHEPDSPLDTSVEAVTAQSPSEPEPDAGHERTPSEDTSAKGEPEKTEKFVEHVPAGPVKTDPILKPESRGRTSSEQSDAKPPRIHPFVETDRDAQSTFAVDVDTGSYTASRKRIRGGSLPDEKLVRVEEFVNYFDYGYANPETGPFGVAVDGGPSPFTGRLESNERRRLLRIGLQGDRLTGPERKSLRLVFLVDVSGSMNDPDKLPLAKTSLKTLARNLQQGDSVAIATYASGSERVLEPTGAANQSAIVEAVDSLEAGGSTSMSSGLQLAYDLASKSFEKDAVNRVVVVSDGNANVGATSHEAILDKVENQVERGVTLSTVGYGVGYNDQMMEQLANNGNGNYFYIDTADEARRIFGEELESTMQVIAKDVKVQVEFDEKAVEKYRLVGYENRDVEDENFRDDDVDAGEIGAGHSVTALYELVVRPDAPRRLGTVRVRHKKPSAAPSDAATEQRFHITRGDLRDSLEGTSGGFQFAAAVAACAEKLRGSPYVGGLSWKWIREHADDAVGEKRRRRDFVSLVRRLETR